MFGLLVPGRHMSDTCAVSAAGSTDARGPCRSSIEVNKMYAIEQCNSCRQRKRVVPTAMLKLGGQFLAAT